jgi:hypothetical protein
VGSGSEGIAWLGHGEGGRDDHGRIRQTYVQWVTAATNPGGNASNLRRDITIDLYSGDGATVLKTIKCSGCFPISLTASGQNKTLTCRMDRIEVS